MSITIQAVWIPWAITLITVAVFLFWPDDNAGGYLNFDAAFRLLFSVIILLVVWLIYFALT